MPSSDYVNTLLFGIYPYVCLAVLLLGSLIRFDREPYTWKSDSSQMLRNGQLRLGSNLFHYGVIIVILGHFAGFLAPHWAVDWALSPVAHQLLAMVVGGIAGLVAIIGLTILLFRRLGDPRIRLNSRKWDIAVVLMLWLQLALGLLTVPLSAFHMDGALFETLTNYVKGVVTLDGRRRRVDGRRAIAVQAAHPPGVHDFPDLALHSHDPHLEWRRRTILSVPALPDCAHAAQRAKEPIRS